MRWGLVLIFFLIEGFTSFSFASFETEVQSEIFKYASSKKPTGYLSTRTEFQSGNFSGLVRGYYESGSQGSFSIDPSILKYTFQTSDSGDSLWIGRDHPLQSSRSTKITPFTALGAAWVQNTTNALDPNVSGWIGMGFVKTIGSEWKIITSYSPVFLPSFGPSLGISERGDLNPARFARLPPNQVTTNGVTVPIRYRIQVDQLSELVFQHQGFIGTAYDTTTVHSDLYVFTAPRPNPLTPYAGTLAVAGNTVNAKINVKPQFPREYWAGTQFQLKEVPFKPSLEFVQNLQDDSNHQLSLTAYVSTGSKLKSSFGFLTHLKNKFDSPSLSDWLAFLQIPINLSDSLDFKTVLQTTLQAAHESFYWFNQFEYHFSPALSWVADMRILAGQSDSYFGEWRSHDSYSTGVKWLW